jgi:pyruvate kinase
MEWLFNYSLLTSPLHSVARFDLSWGDPDYHQEILENLKAAVKTTKKLYVVRFFFYSFSFLNYLLR